jgi:SAM-dependent methyltransferase
MQQVISSKEKSFAEIIEERWADQSEALAEKHLDAAIDAKIAEIDTNHDISTFQRRINERAVSKSNCYSPYVPSNSQRIVAMIKFVVLTPGDVLVDMGCGDGRVCFVASHMMVEQQQQHGSNSTLTSLQKQASLIKFRSIGIDVSSDCIALARQQLMDAKDSNQQNDVDIARCIAFHQADLTLDPSDILCGM